MNSIARKMKRGTRMPFRYVLPLLFVALMAVVAITGCTSPTSSATPTPSGAPTATASVTASVTSTATTGFDPLLAKMEPALKAQYGNVTRLPKDVSQASDELLVTFESNGRITTANIRNDGSTDQASSDFKTLSAPDSTNTLAPNNATAFGQQAATSALGHTPTTINDAYLKGTGESAGLDNEYIQYDQIFIQTTVTPSE